MAISASGEPGSQIVHSGAGHISTTDPMHRMTLLAEKYLRQLKKIIVSGAVRRMAGRTIFRVIGMFIEKGAGFFGMASPAGLSLGHRSQLKFIFGAVRVVAIGAVDLAFLDRMAARQ